MVLVELSIEGFEGYLALPIADPTATRAELAVALPASQTVTTGGYQLRVRVVDALRTASTAATRTLMVDGLGAGGGTATIRGTLQYEKQLIPSGDPCALLASLVWTWRTVAGQPELRVVNARDGSALAGATSTVYADGTYEVQLPGATGALRIEVLARSRGAVQVATATGAPYAMTGGSLTGVAAGSAVPLELLVERSVSAPLSMFEAAIEARNTTLGILGGTIPAATLHWAAGVSRTECSSPTSCFSPSSRCGVATPGEEGHLYIEGGAEDDAWDDPVLRHEYGHLVQCYRSREDSPGGRHDVLDRVAPALAWSEGFATFWGQLVALDRCYWDTVAGGGIFTYYIDNAPIRGFPPPLPTNTDPTDNASGNVSEGLVSGVLWQLSQLSPPARWSGAAFDPLAPLLWTLQSYVTSRAVGLDHGAAGVDLADFLAGWICASPCYDAELREVAVGSWLYNFKNRSSFAQCPAPYTVADGGPRRCSGPYAYVLTESELQRCRFDGAVVNRLALGAPGSVGLATPRNARSMAVLRAEGPAPTRAVVTSFSEGSLALYTIAGGREREVDWTPATASTDRLAVGTSPRGVAVTPDGRYAFVAVSGTDEVAVVDLDARALCKRFAVPREPGSTGPSVPDSVVVLPRARCRGGSSLRGDACTAYVSL
ncbi:MAG: hypothetical protein HY909_08505 [Deltaproteobacteria bacterium]|nr:hypothetical protein [Deltaproteobacteria bacterium]